uniref:Uncharacterized protein n=1 Tax=Globisporangium ultimum (strain ATCC 200006 / CBS 805.95 / DAOM BR144) TaxID=431595 RepID=K3WGT9_GLOUD
MDEDFLAELIGVDAAAVADVTEEAHVVAQESLLAVERAVLETSAAQVAQLLEAMAATAGSAAVVSAMQMAKLICEGLYADVIRTPRGQQLLQAIVEFTATAGDHADVHLCTTVSQALEQFVLKEAEEERLGAAYEVLFVGAAFFNMYVQANYTGPAFDKDQLNDINACIGRIFYGDSEYTDKKLHIDALVALQVDGESPFSICEYPQFLVLGRSLLHFVGNAHHKNWSFAIGETGIASDAQDVISSPSIEDASLLALVGQLQSAAWWNARAAVAHERLLITKESSNTLWFEARRGFFKTLRSSSSVSGLFAFKNSEYLRARLDVEWGLAQSHFDKNKQGKRSFEQAKEVSGVSVQLSGSMGKRT